MLPRGADYIGEVVERGEGRVIERPDVRMV